MPESDKSLCPVIIRVIVTYNDSKSLFESYPTLGVDPNFRANFFWVKSWDPDHEITRSSYLWVIRIKHFDQRKGRPATNEQCYIYIIIYIGIGLIQQYRKYDHAKLWCHQEWACTSNSYGCLWQKTQVNIGNGRIDLCMKPSQAATHNNFTRWLPWPRRNGIHPSNVGQCLWSPREESQSYSKCFSINNGKNCPTAPFVAAKTPSEKECCGSFLCDRHTWHVPYLKYPYMWYKLLWMDWWQSPNFSIQPNFSLSLVIDISRTNNI